MAGGVPVRPQARPLQPPLKKGSVAVGKVPRPGAPGHSVFLVCFLFSQSPSLPVAEVFVLTYLSCWLV